MGAHYTKSCQCCILLRKLLAAEQREVAAAQALVAFLRSKVERLEEEATATVLESEVTQDVPAGDSGALSQVA